MKSLISIVLTSFVFLQSINVHAADLIRVNELLEHAQLHAEEYNDDWLSFLSKHYGDQKEQHQHQDQQEEGEHDELPFQDHLCSHASTVFIVVAKRAMDLDSTILPKVTEGFFYSALYNYTELKDIFQPPKQA